MRIERLPRTVNVLRFPVERRAQPTLALLREIAPDVREVLATAAAWDLESPVLDLRARVDAETAQYILDQFGGGGAFHRRGHRQVPSVSRQRPWNKV